MKILRLMAYYDPDKSSGAHLIKDLESVYANAGFKIEIYCPTPTRGISEEVRSKYRHIKFEEKMNGKIRIHRFAMMREGTNPILRAFRYVLINCIQYSKGIHSESVDVIMAASTPPTQGALCRLVASKLSRKYKKKIPFIYNIHDVFPDSMVTTDLTHEGSLLWKIGRRIEKYTYDGCDKIIVISETIKKNLMNKGVPEDKLVLIHNWVDTDEVKPVPKEENKLYGEFNIPSDKFIVVYAGNFGAAQGADIVIEAASLLKENEDILFVIFGGGAGFEEAKLKIKRYNLNNVLINPLLSQDRVPEVYSLGDVALITCKPGVGNSGMPSKTWSIMACNTPIIASFDTNSELADIIQRANAGICVDPENANILSDAILMYYDNNNIVCESREYVLKYASKKICTSKYVDVMKEFE